jgi:hypothetical protein
MIKWSRSIAGPADRQECSTCCMKELKQSLFCNKHRYLPLFWSILPIEPLIKLHDSYFSKEIQKARGITGFPSRASQIQSPTSHLCVKTSLLFLFFFKLTLRDRGSNPLALPIPFVVSLSFDSIKVLHRPVNRPELSDRRYDGPNSCKSILPHYLANFMVGK